jgi:biotin transport system substrate-specific component
MSMTAMIVAARNRAFLFVVQALGLSLLIAASAHINVPFWPVPMTLQTFAVVLIAATAGASLGLAAMVAYLIEGALGLPVFASGAGLAVLVGPTAGYLAGMLAAMALVGTAIGGIQRAIAMVAATCVIYLFGATWLSQFVGIDRAIQVGVLPFLAGDAAKMALAWAIATAARRSDNSAAKRD